MSHRNYEEIKDSAPAAPNPTTYSEQQHYEENRPLKLPVRPPPPYGVPQQMPSQYQAYYAPTEEASSQGPNLQAPQDVFIAPAQYSSQPDHLAYSIFTMLCCCLPFGIAALIFSVKTKEANRIENSTSAQKNSRLAYLMGHLSLGFGIAIWIFYLTLIIVQSQSV
ncbi:synapse differentiation-inducing gene protein 1-like isoform X1 [Varanus komodoensis]|uniref:synapse differentiation-inducing gene protein 1-like isoform X1 n=1 Tax=Varanus komodoensis TaxID=61221 RepID=UPI001CF7DFA5|nr:synapse differentiation-inducing gene protein 1-like isoform X1 [Varanus komodoensis]